MLSILNWRYQPATFVSVVGSFLFAFPAGGRLGTGVGSLLIAAGIGYAIIIVSFLLPTLLLPTTRRFYTR